MKHIRYILVLLFLLPSLKALPQGSLSSLGFWHQQAFSGEVSLEGIYRQLKSTIGSSNENQRSLYGIAGFKLRSKSYLWLPDLVTLDLDGEFNPETRNEKFITIPNRSEVRTLSKISVLSTILNNKPVTLMPYYNYNQSYFNRESLTNVLSKAQRWGGNVLIKNKILPFYLSYNNLKWKQEETETGRAYTNDRITLEGRVTKSFGLRDKNELFYGYDDLRYTYANRDTTWNIINRINLNNQVYLDSAKNYNFNSRITYWDQAGTNYFRRFDMYENIIFTLPHDFHLSALYNHYRLKNHFQDFIQNRVRADLRHQLFMSLKSDLFIEYEKINQTYYNERNVKFGVGFDYTKKISFGQLNLSYHYYRHHQNNQSEESPRQIFNEPHILLDGSPELLDKPYVDITSIIVKDNSGTIIYQENFDYVLIEQNNFIEIQRVLGGQIPNGGQILVDYVAIQPGSYSFDLNNHDFYIGFLLFDRLIEVYYRGRFQDYTNVKQTEFLTLNYFSQNIYGIRIEKAFARGGIEYDQYLSTIIPYRSMRYYLNLQGNFNNKLLLTLDASLRDYTYIEDDHKQVYGNLSGRAMYTFKAQTRIEFEIGYLRHKAYQTDLSLWTGRLEFSTVIRKLYINAGIDFYSRNYITSNYSLKGVFVKATRKF